MELSRRKKVLGQKTAIFRGKTMFFAKEHFSFYLNRKKINTNKIFFMLLTSLMQCSKVDAITMSNQAAAETIAATHI